MPDPVTHTATSIALSSATVGAVGVALGLDYWALASALFGAVIYRTILPPISSRKEIMLAAGFTVMSTVIGSYGAIWGEIAFKYCMPNFSILISHPQFIIPIAFAFGILGEQGILRAIRLVQNLKTPWEREQ